MKLYFDYMVLKGLKGNRLYFSSTTTNTLYYFEFSWKYVKNLFKRNVYIGLFPFRSKHIKVIPN